MNTEWGIHKLLPLDTFSDVSKGYLDNDSCIFGAEVFVHKYTGISQCLTMLEPEEKTYTWTIDNYSTLLEKKFTDSDVFAIGGRQWKLLLYPKGDAQKEYVFLFLEIVDWVTESPAQRLYAEYKLRIRDQNTTDHVEEEGQNWFDSPSKNWGFRKFLSLRDLNDSTKGYKVKGTVIVEAEINVMALVKNFV